MEKKQYVYILRCADGSLYTGWTTDPERRAEVHNSGKGAKYTRSRRPVEIVHLEEYDDKITAQAREREIKRLTRAKKEQLIAGARPTASAGAETEEGARPAGRCDSEEDHGE